MNITLTGRIGQYGLHFHWMSNERGPDQKEFTLDFGQKCSMLNTHCHEVSLREKIWEFFNYFSHLRKKTVTNGNGNIFLIKWLNHCETVCVLPYTIPPFVIDTMLMFSVFMFTIQYLFALKGLWKDDFVPWMASSTSPLTRIHWNL